MAANSGRDNFPFPAFHENEIKARYENRHSYDFTQLVPKKRKRGPKKEQLQGTTCSTVTEQTSSHSHSLEVDVFQPTPISDSLLVR